MNVLSLFDGMSCGQIALGRSNLSYENYFASEIDRHPMTITQRNFPNTIQLGDVEKINLSNLPTIDLLIGGSPCQGFSIAGDGYGFDDRRSKLFFNFVDILNKLSPRYFLLENVMMKSEWRDIMTKHLGVSPVLINSSSFSAQSRKRYYWTNIPISDYGSNDLTVEDILEDEVDLKYLTNINKSVIICNNEVDRHRIAYIGNNYQGNRIYNIYDKSITLCGGGGGSGAKTGLYAIPCLTPDRENLRQEGRRFKPPGSKFYTLTARDRHGIFTNYFIRRLTPLECERLQTVPDNYTSGVSDSARYKMLGNGWTVDVISHILSGIN